MQSKEAERKVLVTGANGYIGNAVARAFQKAGYTTYGLIRSTSSAPSLESHSIVPIIGSPSISPNEVVSAIKSHGSALDVIVSTTADMQDYGSHFNDCVKLFRQLSEIANENGKRILVLHTSGCEDYGQGTLDGDPDLVMHTEETPLNPPSILADRTKYSLVILQDETFDAAILRPTNVHGGSSSHFGEFFKIASDAKNKGEMLQFNSDPRTILHSMNIDDCAEAYVAPANHPHRNAVRGQCFNISCGKRYETLRDVSNALVKAHSIPGPAQFNPSTPRSTEAPNLLTDFSQYVGSEKIRELTGWYEIQPMFAEGISRYKKEYEIAVEGQARG